MKFSRRLTVIFNEAQGVGDQKFIPSITKDDLEKIAATSEYASRLYQQLSDSIFAIPPSNLGYPSDVAQSSYYHGLRVSPEEVSSVSKLMSSNNIYPENTRILKHNSNGRIALDILQASVETDPEPRHLDGESSPSITLVRGDHGESLNKICECLQEASNYASNPLRKSYIEKLIESFRTGDINTYKDSQRFWIKDKSPPVETVFGFVEPYRDPYGARAEFEGLVGVVDVEETKVFAALVKKSDTFIRRLPWAQGSDENFGKGPFEKSLFDAPDFTSVHGMTPSSDETHILERSLASGSFGVLL